MGEGTIDSALERRRFFRADLEKADAGSMLLILRHEHRVPALALEVGLGGVRIECEPTVPIAKGDSVLIRLGTTSVEDVVTLPGNVAWIRPLKDGCRCELGLSFAGGRNEVVVALSPFLRVVAARRDGAVQEG